MLAIAAVVAGLGTTHAANVSWVGPNLSFWDLAVNWSPGLPGAADDVLLGGFETEFRSGNVTVRSFTGTGLLHVSGGTLQATAASSIGSLALAGGSLGSGVTLAVAGPSTWTGGTLFGAGSTSFASSLAISGAASKQISGGLTVNAGNTTWSGNTAASNNAVAFANSSTFNNTGTFTDSNAFASSMSGAGTFNNAGTYNKQSNTTSTLAVAFNNTGTVNVNAGTLLPAGSGTSSGTFNIANGATLEFRNGSHTLNNITTAGAGTFAVTTDNVGADALVTLNGGTLTSAFLFGGSTLTGTDHVFQGAATWTGGTLTGAASTTFASSLAVTGATGKQISGGRTVNAGNTTWSGNTASGNNAIAFAGASVFNSTGTFTDSNGFASIMSGAGTFNNTGTFTKLSNTETTLALTFNSTGTVNVNAGTLLPAGGGTSSGTFNIANGAMLEYRNGNHTLNNITTSGAGTFAVTSDNVGADAIVTLNGGTHTTAFLLGGSTLTGTDQVFQGHATWTGGALSGAASTTFNNDVTISGANTKVVTGGRVVNLTTTTTWTGNTASNNNAIQFLNGGTINNKGTFIDANPFASFIEHSVGGPHNFNNIGTYNKLANTVTTVDAGVAFNNTGTVNLNAGTFRPSGGGTSTGVFNIAAGATLNFLDGTSTLNNATTQGTGTFLISTDNVGADAVVNVNGGTHTTPFVLSGSTLSGGDHTFQGIATWSGGAISGAASTTFANNVAITGANTKVVVGGRVVNLNGTTTWSGNTADNNNAIQFWNGGTINNNATFNDANAFASFIEHNVGGPHNFNNNGVYNKTSNTVTTVDLGVVFNNSGTLNVNAGTMRFFSGTQGPTGTINVAAGATYQHDAVSTVGRLVTAGTTALSNRNLTVFGDYDNANFGVGNAFNARANVTGTGLIVAAGTPGSAQVLTGAGLPTGSSLTGGTTAAPTLTIGNVRVGNNALAYQIANNNTGGPAVRGAIQTAVGGASITDPRLSGSGVTAANFGPIAPGANAGFVVNFNAPTAGALAPLTGQVVRIANNFDNVAEQNMNIVLGNGAAAYQLAAGQLNTPSLNFGTVQVGQSVSSLLSVTNIAQGPAGFVEDLNARFGASSGTGANLISGSGSFANLVAGATNGNALQVNVNTAAAGVVNGAIAVNYFSAGAVNGVSNGLGELGVGSAAFGVTGGDPGRRQHHQPGVAAGEHAERQPRQRSRRRGVADAGDQRLQRRHGGAASGPERDHRGRRADHRDGRLQRACARRDQRHRPRRRHADGQRRPEERHRDRHLRLRCEQRRRLRTELPARDRHARHQRDRQRVPPRQPDARPDHGERGGTRRRRQPARAVRCRQRVARRLHRATERELRSGRRRLRRQRRGGRPRRRREQQCARAGAQHGRRRHVRRNRARRLRLERRRHHRGARRERGQPRHRRCRPGLHAGGRPAQHDGGRLRHRPQGRRRRRAQRVGHECGGGGGAERRPRRHPDQQRRPVRGERKPDRRRRAGERQHEPDGDAGHSQRRRLQRQRQRIVCQPRCRARRSRSRRRVGDAEGTGQQLRRARPGAPRRRGGALDGRRRLHARLRHDRARLA
jgi:hypothetical protein